MAQTIKIKRSETVGNVPTGSDLATHEIAMNVSDKKIYTKKEDGTIVAVANFNDPDATVDLSDVLAMSIALG
jgi:hypothetical protein|tara:strand:+ start:87 stop:302 length:216 start_codon:yes stop_codon:yes gene_type:complete